MVFLVSCPIKQYRLFDNFHKEILEDQPKKSNLKRIWGGFKSHIFSMKNQVFFKNFLYKLYYLLHNSYSTANNRNKYFFCNGELEIKKNISWLKTCCLMDLKSN